MAQNPVTTSAFQAYRRPTYLPEGSVLWAMFIMIRTASEERNIDFLLSPLCRSVIFCASIQIFDGDLACHDCYVYGGTLLWTIST